MQAIVGFSIATVFFLIFTGVVQPQRFLDKETKLGVFDSQRIAGIDDEFMRRSHGLRVTFYDFEQCGSSCDARHILERRDAIIRLEWPQLLDRLLVKKDWGEATNSKIARDAFFQELEKRGIEQLRNSCVPRIEYRWPVRGGKKVVWYAFTGFDCNKKSAGNLPGGFFFLLFFQIEAHRINRQVPAGTTALPRSTLGRSIFTSVPNRDKRSLYNISFQSG